MVILLKIKRRDFFSSRQHSYFGVSHCQWKLGSSNCCIFEMKHATGMGTCTKMYFLFIFNLVKIRIRKTSQFGLYNLMKSLWKPSIPVSYNLKVLECSRTPGNIQIHCNKNRRFPSFLVYCIVQKNIFHRIHVHVGTAINSRITF